MRKFDLSLRSSRSSYFATFRHQLTILSKTDALDEEKWLNMLGTFVKDWFRYESHFVHGRDSLVDILKERGLLSESDAVQSSSVPTTLPTAYDVYPLDGRHDGGYYTVKDCVTIDVLPRTPGNNVYVGFMVWSNFTATKCRGLVSLNQVIKEIICLQPLK